MNNNYLSHRKYKYLFKEKKNGKWIYYYDSNNRIKGKYNVEEVSPREHLNRSNIENFEAGVRYEGSKHNAQKAYKKFNNKKNNTFGKINAKKDFDKYAKDVKKYKKEYKETKKARDEARSDYLKTPLGKIEYAASKGAAAIEKILKKRKK